MNNGVLTVERCFFWSDADAATARLLLQFVVEITTRRFGDEDAPTNYLWTLAPPPFISFSTSSFEAIEVSPGVVIASAPCAAP
jgi:hypothetical protein